MLKHGVVIAVAIALLSPCACSGPGLGGVVQRSAFDEKQREATGITYVRSIRIDFPGAMGRARASSLVLLAGEQLVVADAERGLAGMFSLDGDFITYLEAPGAFRAGAVAEGPGMAVYVLESDGPAVYRFDATGQLTGEAYSDEEGRRFKDLCYDKMGALYLSSTEADEIIAVEAGLVGERALGGFGGGRGMFVDPMGLATDGRNRLYVCDSGNSRVQVLDQWGAVLAVWSLKAEGRLPRPETIAADRWGNAFIGDSGCRCLRVLSHDGAETFRLDWGAAGFGSGGGPAGLDVHSGALYVGGELDGTVRVFDITYAL